MKIPALLTISIIFGSMAFADEATDKDVVIQTIDEFFAAMTARNTTCLTSNHWALA